MRDITKVIARIKAVIPAEELVHGRLDALLRRVAYSAPELQQNDWDDLEAILMAELGPTEGVEWKIKVSRIIKNEDDNEGDLVP